MKSLHELALPGYRQVTGDFAQPGGKQTQLELLYSHVINVELSFLLKTMSPLFQEVRVIYRTAS